MPPSARCCRTSPNASSAPHRPSASGGGRSCAAALGENVSVLLPLAPALATLLGERAARADPVAAGAGGPAALRLPQLHRGLRQCRLSLRPVHRRPAMARCGDFRPAGQPLRRSAPLDPVSRCLSLQRDGRGASPSPDAPGDARRSACRWTRSGWSTWPFADLAGFVADALRTTHEAAAPLARLVHEKTAGNPFFAGQFLTALVDEGLIGFDHGARAWRWDLARIEAKGMTDNVGELVASRLDPPRQADTPAAGHPRLPRQQRAGHAPRAGAWRDAGCGACARPGGGSRRTYRALRRCLWLGARPGAGGGPCA